MPHTQSTIEPTRALPERLAAIEALKLSRGKHDDLESGLCVMEAVAYVAGEPWSDTPQCACPIIAAFLVSWNDELHDEDRTRLLQPLIPMVIGTRSTLTAERRRAMMVADWLIRMHVPAWLRLAGLDSRATALESLSEITGLERCVSLTSTLVAARQDADAGVAWSPTCAAALAAALAAARAAAVNAARSASLGCYLYAAWFTARSAARAAARASTESAMKSTTTHLQASAVALVRRMCEVQAQ